MHLPERFKNGLIDFQYVQLTVSSFTPLTITIGQARRQWLTGAPVLWPRVLRRKTCPVRLDHQETPENSCDLFATRHWIMNEL